MVFYTCNIINFQVCTSSVNDINFFPCPDGEFIVGHVAGGWVRMHSERGGMQEHPGTMWSTGDLPRFYSTGPGHDGSYTLRAH